MTSFADSWEYQELLAISKDHLDSLDPARVRQDVIIGTDNYAKLKVSTVFAAISIEAALNNFILMHCLFIDTPYLQEVFGTITEKFRRSSIHEKIALLRKNWPDEIPDALIEDVKELFRIRNRVTHESGEFITANRSEDGSAVVKNRPLTNKEMQHMRRHHDIAHDFLSRFWFPGNRELNHRPPQQETSHPERSNKSKEKRE